VVVDLRDPGNAGTLLRTAEAAGAVGLVLAGGSVDPDSPKVLRASAGARFRLPVWRRADPRAAVAELADLGWEVVATVVDADARPYDAVALSGAALVLGNEASGLGPDVIGACTTAVTIPLDGPTESLNVAVAGAVLCFEALRQRRAAAPERPSLDPDRPTDPAAAGVNPLDNTIAGGHR
jgi:TrmH family RNA methyltransferase